MNHFTHYQRIKIDHNALLASLIPVEHNASPVIVDY